MFPLEELEEAYDCARRSPQFQAELDRLFHDYSGRPTPLYFAERLTRTWGGPRIYLKR
jgi:tryptophan synthase beta chain